MTNKLRKTHKNQIQIVLIINIAKANIAVFIIYPDEISYSLSVDVSPIC